MSRQVAQTPIEERGSRAAFTHEILTINSKEEGMNPSREWSNNSIGFKVAESAHERAIKLFLKSGDLRITQEAGEC